MKKPSVNFIEHIPVNPYVFANGLVCLDILDTDWSPILRVSSVTLSILSMLSSTTEKKKPANDDDIVKKGLKNFNMGKWYHNYKDV